MTANSAKIRIVHNVPNAPAINVYLDGKELLSDVAYKTVSDYLKVSSGSHQISIIPVGSNTSLVSQNVILSPNTNYTLLIEGLLPNGQNLVEIQLGPGGYYGPNWGYWGYPGYWGYRNWYYNWNYVRPGYSYWGYRNLSPYLYGRRYDEGQGDGYADSDGGQGDGYYERSSGSDDDYHNHRRYYDRNRDKHHNKYYNRYYDRHYHNRRYNEVPNNNANPPANPSVVNPPAANPSVIPPPVNQPPQPAQVELIVLQDDLSCPNYGQAKVRVIHGAAGVPPVDVYINNNQVLSNVTYGANSGSYIPITAGNIQLSVNPAGSNKTVLGPLPLSLKNGEVYTVIISGIPGNTNTPLTALLTEDSKGLCINTMM